MRLFRTLAATALVAIAGAACADLEVTNLNAPDRERALATANDVENLIAGSFQTLWGGWYVWAPAPALSVAADAHSASWGNFMMRDISEEPRKQINNSPSYSYAYVVEDPWRGAYAAISAASDGLAAIDDGLEIGANGANNARAQFMAKLVQGLAHGYLAILFDKAFIVDENTDLSTVDANAFKTPAEVHAAGMAKLDEALAIAQANDFVVPAEWVGYFQSWDKAYQIKVINGFKARLTAGLARTPAERAALNWGNIKSWATASFTGDERFSGYDDGDNWSWMVNKTYAGAFSGYYGWGRIDVRHIGPSDTTANGYAGWLGTPTASRNAINIYTPDKRVTGATYQDDGTMYTYWGGSPFPASRGTYHYSHYSSGHWDYFVLDGDDFVGEYPDLTATEMEFLIAEAEYRAGDKNVTMTTVNKYRAMGQLSPFTSTTGTAPLEGTSATSCVPRPAGAACGDLLEALKYEKRIVLHHYGPGTEFTDDRGWGDLVTGTPVHFPVPGAELEILLEDIYTFGGAAGGAAPGIVTDLSPEALSFKAQALARYNKEQMVDSKRNLIVH